MITVKNLSKHFGGIKAVDGVDLHIDRGSITGLVGPNGAGKTTMFNLIAGLYQPTEGEIILDGENVTELSSHQLFHKGLLRTFQISHEFPTLSVLENLMMVPANQLGEHLMNTWLKRKQIQEEEKILQEKAEGVIDFLNISHLKNERAGNLSGGQKEITRVGSHNDGRCKSGTFRRSRGRSESNTIEADWRCHLATQFRKRLYTFCMIEHDMDFISRLCNPVVVLAEGQILTIGSPDEIKSSDAVIDAYLGKGLRTEISA